MLKNKISIVLIALSLLGGMSSLAQNNTNSPYSRYGYGILEDNAVGANRGMGGVGYGFQSGRQINIKHPASYAAMDSLTFLFDIGVSLQNTWMKENSLKESEVNGNLDYVALQFPLGRHMAGSAGLTPFSSVGYSFGGSIPNGSYTQVGEGGISQAFIGLSGHIYKGLYLGANVSYLFGNIEHTTTLLPTDNTIGSIFLKKLHVSDFRVEFGLQYTHNINKKNRITVGAVYTPEKKLLGRTYTYEEIYSTTSGSTSISRSDSSSIKSRYSLPTSIGAGFTYVWDERLTVGADVTFQDWSSVRYDGVKDSLNNRLKVAIGAEFLPNPMSGNYMKRMRYRLGAFYNHSYLKVKGCDIDEYGITCGFGFPVRRDKSILNLSLEYLNRQSTPTSFIRENFLRVSLSLTFNELWFFKRKFE